MNRDYLNAAVFACLLLSLGLYPSNLFAAEQAPGSPNNAFAFAESLFAEGDYYRAISEYKRVIFFFPQDALVETCRFRIGESYFQAKRWTEAIEAFQNFISRYPGGAESPKAAYLKGLAEKNLKRFADAQSTFDALLKNERSDLADQAAMQKAFILMERDEWQKAIETLQLVNAGTPRGAQAKKMAAALGQADALPQKSPGLAGAMAAVLPGSGHLYADRPKDAAVAFLLNASFLAAAVELFRKDCNILGGLVVFFEAGWYFGNLYSAVNSTQQYNRTKKDEFLKRLKEEADLAIFYNPFNRTTNLAVSFHF